MAVRESVSRIAGFRALPLPTNQNNMCWINNWHPEMDCTKVTDLTRTEMETRDTIRDVVAYLKEAIPVAFRDAYLYDIAPQPGLRCSRRLIGEYVMTANDFAFARKHEDVIAWHSTICQINDCGPVEIPYRAIIPQKIDGLLCPGRHLSADDVAIDWLNLIPQCVGTGQAAGVAAAVAVADNSTVRDVDIKKVQDVLVKQDVPLPRRDDVDPEYTRCCEEHEYGLYTDMAKQAREAAGVDKTYRQW
ncbi:MAG: FAD-dependent oxidoreductase [Clostridiales bacterium]|nr:FAD-dependent oxidoreductase [Clostridiales bacterium]